MSGRPGALVQPVKSFNRPSTDPMMLVDAALLLVVVVSRQVVTTATCATVDWAPSDALLCRACAWCHRSA